MPRFTTETAKAMAEKSKSKEAKEKRKKTMAHNTEMRNLRALSDTLVRKSLFEINPETSHTYAEDFLLEFRNEAIKDPSSRAGALFAEMLISADALDRMDREADRIISRDIAFARYRLGSTLFKEQKQVIEDALSRKITVMCSRRAGKTELNARILVNACLDADTPVCYVHLTFANGIEQLWDKVITSAKIAGLVITNGKKLEGQKNEGIIKFSNGSSIKFCGNSNKDEQEKIRGFKYRVVIVDEAQSQKGLRYLIDEVIQPLLFDFADSKLYLTGTPPRIPHSFFERCFKSIEYTKYHWDMRVNPFIPNAEEEIENLCKQKGLEKDNPFIQREYYGLIAYDIDALVFRDYKTWGGEEIPADFIPTHAYIGVDFGFADYNSVVCLVTDNDKKQGYIRCVEKWNKSTVSVIVETIKKCFDDTKDFCIKRNKTFDLNNIGIYADTNEKSIVYELSYTYALPAYCAYKYDRMFAISHLADSCRSGRILCNSADYIADEFEQIVYKRDKDTDAILNEIDDDTYHPESTMALLYAYRQFAYDMGEDAGGDAKPIE